MSEGVPPLPIPPAPRVRGRWVRALAVVVALAALVAAASAQPSPTTPARSVAEGAPSAAAAPARELWASRDGRERIFDALVEVVRSHYWDPGHLDWDRWAADHRDAVLTADSRPALDTALRRMVAALGDDHSSWVGLARPEAPPGGEPPASLGVRYGYVEGIGIVLERVFEGGPAAAAGLRRGDVVVAVNDRPVDALRYRYEAVEILAGAVRAGALELVLASPAGPRRLRLEPAPLDAGEAAARPQAEMLSAATGYLYLPSFRPARVAVEAHRLIDDLRLQGARSLVLDLRGNTGGRLGELGLLLGAFVDGPWGLAWSRGEVAWQGRFEDGAGLGRNLLERPDGRVLFEDPIVAPTRFRGAVVVLVDRDNASAGEIAALALQARGRARVVGEVTAGNVEAVRGFELPDGSLVLIAVADVRGVDGAPFSGGVVPDVPARAELTELARGFDAPVAEALRLLEALPFTPGRFF